MSKPAGLLFAMGTCFYGPNTSETSSRGNRPSRRSNLQIDIADDKKWGVDALQKLATSEHFP